MHKPPEDQSCREKTKLKWILDNVSGILIRLQTGGFKVKSPCGTRFFSCAKRRCRPWGSPRTKFLSQGKVKGHEVDHSTLKNTWSYTSNPLIHLPGMERENITCYDTFNVRLETLFELKNNEATLF